MTRLRARSTGGGRIHEATPGGHWKIMTILGAMSLRGMVAAMTIEEATADALKRITPDNARAWFRLCNSVYGIS